MQGEGTGPRSAGAGEQEEYNTRELLSRARAGDAGGWDALLCALEGPLSRRARRLCDVYGLGGHTTRDLVQETLKRAIEGRVLERFEWRGRGSLLALLFKVMDRAAADIGKSIRTQKRGASVSKLSLDETVGGRSMRDRVPSTEPTPTSSARVEEYRRRFREVLTESEWRVWDLVEIQGLTAVEASQRLGRTDSAVRSLLHRVRRKLIDQMGDGDAGERLPGGES